MTLGARLSDCRNKLRWTQTQISTALKVPRELVSMWENDVRKPNVRQVEDLALLLGTTAKALLTGSENAIPKTTPGMLLRGWDTASPEVKKEMNNWLGFLDEWSDFIDESSHDLKSQAPRKLDKGPDFSDIRSASKLAADVREHFNLGLYALPDLYTFLDDYHITVCQAKLGAIGEGNDGISGIFLNHEKLGYCILINAQTSKGRQMFTLAHEFGHALYHYGAKSIVSYYGERNAREQFADAFAAHFLVPGKGLRNLIEENEWAKQMSEHVALILANYFNVSYAFMLNRLAFEGLISTTQRSDWQNLSPKSLAQQIGLDPELFRSRLNDDLYSNRYPASVITRVRELIEEEELTIAQAADLLRLDPLTIQTNWMNTAANADENEQRELAEFALVYGSSKI